MKVTQACPICAITEGCGCKAAFTQFFELLGQVQDRETVSTQIRASAQRGLRVSRVLIDKLCGQLLQPIANEELSRRAAEFGFRHAPTKLKDNKWYLKIGDPDRCILFRLGHPHNPVTSHFVSRPSAFENFDKYRAVLEAILTPSELRAAKISRLDVAIDYHAPLRAVMMGFDVLNKRHRCSYLDKGSVRTGMKIGAGPEKIIVYDKALESGSGDPITRIEIQLTGSKLPTKSFAELAARLIEWRPFQNVRLNEVTMRSTGLLTEAQKARHSELHHTLRYDGLLSARYRLGENRNFDRDYGSLMNVAPWSEQPTDAYAEHIKKILPY